MKMFLLNLLLCIGAQKCTYLFFISIVVILIVLLSFCDVHVEVCGHTHNWSFFMSTSIFFYNLCNDKAALNVYMYYILYLHILSIFAYVHTFAILLKNCCIA